MTTDDAKAEASRILDEAGIGARRAEIFINDRNPVDVADQIVAEIFKVNDPPRLFAMGAIACCAHADGTLEAYDADAWLLHVARLIDFLIPAPTRYDPDRVKIVNPPAHPLRMVPKDILRKLPVLDGITHTPYLTVDGGLVQRDGYDAESRLILHSDVTLPPIPDVPGASDLSQAVKLLNEEWLGDFPFVSQTARANALALLLTLTGRALFGLAPLTIIDASTPGSGKGLLLHTSGLIATGKYPELMELPADGEEQRKKVTTALMAGNNFLAWDESHVIKGKTLAMILTAETYKDRVLGGNKMFRVRNRFTQVALGNNVSVYGDMKRRVVPVRLEPDDEHPERRDNFRHPDLAQWVLAHRGELLGAVLTIWRGWITAGRPMAPITMGSFERWARAVGGALANAGITGFLEGTAEWLEFSDPDADGWGEHLKQLHNIYGEKWFTVPDVIDLQQLGEIKLPPYKRDPSRSLAHIVGNMYRGARGRWWGQYRLEPSPTLNSASGSRTWRVLHRAALRAPGESAYQSQESQKRRSEPS
jgi:hypothetical protein